MEIKIPRLEKRKFVGGTLDNNVKFININDKELDKSIVVVSVNIGSLHEPHEFQGLAHFLEHMLFLGSKKYPGEDSFENFLNQNGGYSNAYTDTFETVYYFSVLNKELETAIDMFSRFFIDPLFDQDSVNREIKAIESEHNKNVNQDIWRLFHFFGLTSLDNSMINKFSTGNLETLDKPGVRDAMMSFYKKYYISSKINVVTLSSLDSNIVKNYIKKSFSKIPKKDSLNLEIEKPFYSNKGQSYFLKSVSKKQSLIYYWEIPAHVTNYLNTHSDYILLHVISSDNEKSIKQFLISKGLIKNLYCIIKEEGVFIVDFELTKLSNWKKVDSYFRYYISKLADEKWSKICKYYQDKDKVLFDYSAKVNSEDLGMKLATNLSYYPLKDSFIGTSVASKINESEIEDLLQDYFNFDRANIILSSNEFSDTDIELGEIKTEPYYNLEFSKINIKPNEPKYFDFELIDSNPFLTIEPKVYTGSSDYFKPTMINKNVWFGNVFKFGESRIYSILSFVNFDFISELTNYMCTEVFIKYLNKKIEKVFHLASEIGFHTSLSLNSDSSTLNISIYGYNDKFTDYFNYVMDYLKDFNYKEEDKVILEAIFNEMKDDYSNIKNKNPWSYRSYLESLNVNKNSYKIEEIVSFLKSFTVESFANKLNEVKNRILYNSKFTSFFYGNTTKEYLFSKNSLNLTFLKSIDRPKNVLKKLTDIDVKHPNKDEKDNYVQLSFIIGKFYPIQNLLLLILAITISQKFYDVLRTKKQFGYLVSANRQRIQDNYYFVERVESKKSIKEIESAIIDFNNNFLDTIDEEEFKKFVETSKKLLQEKENNTRELYSKYAEEIIDEKFLFDREDLLLRQIDNIDFKMFKKFYKEKVKNASAVKVYIHSNK